MTARLLPSLLAVLWMALATVAASPFTLAPGALAVAAGALLGVPAGAFLARTRLRTALLPMPALGIALAAVLVSALLERWSLPASLVGSRALYALAEILPGFAVPLGAVGVLEALARRARIWRLAGTVLMAALFASLFAAHREGFLSRPTALVDVLWGNGLDPLPWLLALGLLLAILLLVVLAGPGRRLAGLGILAALLAVLFLVAPRRHLKDLAQHQAGQGQGGALQTLSGKVDGKEGGGKGENKAPPQDFQDQDAGRSDAPVAVVVFHSDYRPPMGGFYFRETAFSAFNGARLVQDVSRRFDRDLPGAATSVLPASPGEPVRTTVALMANHAHPFGLVNPVAFRETANPDPRRFFQAYEVRSRVCPVHPKDLLEAEAGDPAWDPATWAYYTQGPADSRFARLAEDIVGKLPPALRGRPFARAVAIKLWMDANTIYSLATTHGASPDPVADFLFGDRRGHCVYLAHAACLLYRAAGVPARVGAGYASDPAFRMGGASLLLRGSDAHAWPEVRLKDAGWLPLDIQPARSEAPPQEAPDKDLQQMLGEMAESDQPPPPPPDPARPPLAGRLLRLARILGAILAVLAILALPACWGAALWRRLVPAFAADRSVPRLAFRAALDAISAHGLRRRRSETREAFARRAAQRCPALEGLTALHLAWALGSRKGPVPAAEGRLLLREVRRQLRAGAGPFQNLLAFLDPLAWTRVR
jgi:hypothetical protein